MGGHAAAVDHDHRLRRHGEVGPRQEGGVALVGRMAREAGGLAAAPGAAAVEVGEEAVRAEDLFDVVDAVAVVIASAEGLRERAVELVHVEDVAVAVLVLAP